VNTTASSYDYYGNLANTFVAGETVTMSCQVRLISGSATNFVLAWEYYSGSGLSAEFSAADGLNTSTWTTISLSRVAQTSMFFEFGKNGHHTGNPQTAGQVQLRNFTVTAPRSITTTFSSGVTMSAPLTVNSTIHCTTLTQTSDQSVKACIEDISTETANAILSGVSARTFIRTDLEEDPTKVDRRVGMIAQELQAACPNEWINITQESNGLLGVSYDRLVCILWTCLKDTNARLAVLEAAT